jgi:hypothetical protein
MNGSKVRLLSYAKQKKYSARKFAALLGLSNAYFSTDGGISSDILEKIDSLFPDLDLYWVITGKGDMTKQGYLSPQYTDEHLSNPADTKYIMDLAMPVEETINILRDKVSLFVQEVKVKDKIIARQNEIITQLKKPD